MKIRFRNLSISDPDLKADLLAAVERVFEHGRFLLGPEVEAFEEQFADRCERRLAIGVSSGTGALYLALRALGIGPGDEVVTTPLSWIATLQAISLTGATPVFADIGDDLNLDIEEIPGLLSPRTKAIVPVHFNGRLCDMARLTPIAADAGVPIIEDAAQAFGAKTIDSHAGGSGLLAAFSLNPMKNPMGFGEGGVVLTDSEDLAERLRALRYIGTIEQERCVERSLNFKMDTLQAAMLLVSMERTEEVTRRRIEVARRYTEGLSGLVDCPPVEEKPGHRPCVFFDYTIRTPDRDALRAFLGERGIEVKVKHGKLMPDQPAFADLAPSALPRARTIVQQILSLPIHEKLSDADIQYVIDSVRAFYGD